jgi:LPXTG-site transpeptidase (sortase) family protein
MTPDDTARGLSLRVWLGNSLMAAGVALLFLTGVLYGYAEYERFAFERDLARAERLDAATATTIALQVAVETATSDGLATATATAQGRQTPTPAPTAAPAAGAAIPATPVPAATPAPPPPPTATPIPVLMRRVVAPSIGLDSPVIEAKLQNGEWEVPKFVAGHLQGTGLPGSGGNVVLSGHVQSISSGNVFNKIDQLKAGDEVIVKTNVGDVRYVVEGKNIVKPDDLSVVQANGREELTLITCTGTFNPITQDYDRRWVVWGVRAP